MTLLEFVSAVNRCKPTYEQIAAHGTSEQVMLQYETGPRPNTPEEKLRQLFERTNIRWSEDGPSWTPTASFNFHAELQDSPQVPDSVEFATINEHDRLALDRQTWKILWYTREDSQHEVFARDLEQFLAFMLECYRYEMHVVFGVAYEQKERFASLKEMIRQGLSKEAVAQLIQGFN